MSNSKKFQVHFTSAQVSVVKQALQMGIMRSDDKSWNSVATRAVEALEMVMPGDDLARAAQIVTRTIEENDIRSLVKVPIEQMRRLKKALKTRKKRVTHYGHYSTDGTNSCEHYAR